MRVDGGEAAALTRSKESIGAFEWAPDGQEIAFLAADGKIGRTGKEGKGMTIRTATKMNGTRDCGFWILRRRKNAR